jgi:hypothetical protein
VEDSLVSFYVREASVGTTAEAAVLALLTASPPGEVRDPPDRSAPTTDIKAPIQPHNEAEESPLLGAKSEKAHWILTDCTSADLGNIRMFNSALDGACTISFSRGERLCLAPSTRILFETDFVRMLSPATLSRYGIVYVDDGVISSQVVVEPWLSQLKAEHKIPPKASEGTKTLANKIAETVLQTLPPIDKMFSEQLSSLFRALLAASLPAALSSINRQTQNGRAFHKPDVMLVMRMLSFLVRFFFFLFQDPGLAL